MCHIPQLKNLRSCFSFGRLAATLSPSSNPSFPSTHILPQFATLNFPVPLACLSSRAKACDTCGSPSSISALHPTAVGLTFEDDSSAQRFERWQHQRGALEERCLWHRHIRMQGRDAEHAWR
ncbi:hypothetical protein AN958_01621 [Leucoagaricus sp. SymC.cos]|nr:hypothetical protein AN958_01621 [Leucoagaricus sp. SymC.cos]